MMKRREILSPTNLVTNVEQLEGLEKEIVDGSVVNVYVLLLVCRLQHFNCVLERAADFVLVTLYELGYMNATVWAASNSVQDLVKENKLTFRS
ncbi:hypothetical protein M8C21_027534 [Ambrosia artemisiifolia]|uniref:Uncharacterized protein n=1 Tax=Ambrosia artemisiifolia TaxID=4212 RepID=A0AAD5BXC7_AMBAR|nr:hypothetical protein M8C21_027534 [Ambrosia artemisiifolia]